jgi:hypothetical protein
MFSLLRRPSVAVDPSVAEDLSVATDKRIRGYKRSVGHPAAPVRVRMGFHGTAADECTERSGHFLCTVVRSRLAVSVMFICSAPSLELLQRIVARRPSDMTNVSGNPTSVAEHRSYACATSMYAAADTLAVGGTVCTCATLDMGHDRRNLRLRSFCRRPHTRRTKRPQHSLERPARPLK